MPFRSEAQRRLFHAMADRGEISEAKVKEWEDETKNKKNLPMYVSKKRREKKSELYETGIKLALEEVGLLKQAGLLSSLLIGAPVGALIGAAIARRERQSAARRFAGLQLLGALGGGTLGAGAGALIGRQFNQAERGALGGGGLGALLGQWAAPFVSE